MGLLRVRNPVISAKYVLGRRMKYVFRLQNELPCGTFVAYNARSSRPQLRRRKALIAKA
jgi:hypothetical protein